MIHLDTSALIDALSGPRRSQARLRELIQEGERLAVSAIVLYEWRRGPRSPEEIADQESLFPASESVAFTSAEAIVAADLYRKLKRARGREIDVAIAACALVHSAQLWTLNSADFKDIPHLQLLA